MSYCEYCGSGYDLFNCQLCNKKMKICYCDDNVCDEHYCLICDTASLTINESGECSICESQRLDTEHYHILRLR